MRRRKLTRAALAADFGVARVGMPVRAKFEVVRSPTEITEEWFTGGDPVAIVAIVHIDPQMSESG
jgi:hypothetical protein